MMEAVQAVHFRGILESRGNLTVEAEIHLENGVVGAASAPCAIMPGRRERRRSFIKKLGPLDEEAAFAEVRRCLEKGSFASQLQFDSSLEKIPSAMELGADVRLVLSVAFARASAASAGISLAQWLNRTSDVPAAMPRLLVNVFSGGIHDPTRKLPLQQIMFVPDFGNVYANIEAALEFYRSIESRLEKESRQFCYSSSSGMLVNGSSHLQLLDEISNATCRLGYSKSQAFLGIDVAAEHLLDENGRYRIGESTMSGAELLAHLVELSRTYNVQFLEDPFDATDSELWRECTRQLHPSTIVVGDDLFSTDGANIEPGLASGILLKPNQIGSISGTLDAARVARGHGLRLAVSHRSGETEDTVICDLAVALGAAYVKVGGPRRGDRTAKYNQLLRLAEQLSGTKQ